MESAGSKTGTLHVFPRITSFSERQKVNNTSPYQPLVSLMFNSVRIFISKWFKIYTIENGTIENINISEGFTINSGDFLKCLPEFNDLHDFHFQKNEF